MEKLRNALKVLIVLTEKTTDALEDDNRIDWMEGSSIAISAFGLISVLKSLKEIGEEFRSMTTQQRTELAQWFSEEFDIPNDNLEVVIEEIFEQLLLMGDLFDTIATLK